MSIYVASSRVLSVLYSLNFPTRDLKRISQVEYILYPCSKNMNSMKATQLSRTCASVSAAIYVPKPFSSLGPKFSKHLKCGVYLVMAVLTTIHSPKSDGRTFDPVHDRSSFPKYSLIFLQFYCGLGSSFWLRSEYFCSSLYSYDARRKRSC